MKLKLFLSLFIIFSFAGSVSAQRLLTGEVFEVIDGKTMVIETINKGKITIQLQYIEVPETEQQLSDLVKQHLTNLIKGKKVEYRGNGIVSDKTVGAVYLNGIDIAQQMLRDGAAWYAVNEIGSQPQIDRENYQLMETAAKTESRGVWSVKDLKPAWQFREEKAKAEELKKQQAHAAWLETQKNKQSTGSKRLGLTQLDIGKGEKSESVHNNDNTVEKDSQKYKIIDALKEMRELLLNITEVGVTQTEFRQSYFAIRRKVYEASESLSSSRLKILMQENVEVLKDLEIVIDILKGKNPFFYYRGGVVGFAEKYLIQPVRNNAGDFIITKQMIVDTLIQKVDANYGEIFDLTKDGEF